MTLFGMCLEITDRPALLPSIYLPAGLTSDVIIAIIQSSKPPIPVLHGEKYAKLVHPCFPNNNRNFDGVPVAADQHGMRITQPRVACKPQLKPRLPGYPLFISMCILPLAYT